MKKSIVFFILLVLIILFVLFLINQSFCSKPIVHFNEVIKKYYAPKSDLKIIVHSKNYVDEASDLGNGNAFVKLFKLNQKCDTVFLITSPENIDFITFRKKKIKFECSQMQPNNLFDFLKEKGFKNLDENEIAELRNAMTLINYGPKVTFLVGQTKFIDVIN